MIRNRIGQISFISSIFQYGADNVSIDTKTAQDADLSIVRHETGLDRVRQLLQKDDFGRLSPEIHSIFQAGCLSVFIGALYGGIVYSRETYIDFIKNNQATAFTSHIEAKKKLQDQITRSFSKGAFKWAWRLSFFTTTYVAVSTTLATYRGKNGILEHTIAGALAGFVYRFKLGPRAWVVGSGLGCVLGTFAGITTLSFLRLTGMTMEEVRYWNYKWLQARNDNFNREFSKHLEKEKILILKERESILENTGADLSSVDIKKQ